MAPSGGPRLGPSGFLPENTSGLRRSAGGNVIHLQPTYTYYGKYNEGAADHQEDDRASGQLSEKWNPFPDFVHDNVLSADLSIIAHLNSAMQTLHIRLPSPETKSLLEDWKRIEEERRRGRHVEDVLQDGVGGGEVRVVLGTGDDLAVISGTSINV